MSANETSAAASVDFSRTMSDTGFEPVEIDDTVPDLPPGEVDAEDFELDKLLDELEEAADDFEPFSSFEEMMTSDVAERDGVWKSCPVVAGARVKIARLTEAYEAQQKEERRYRSKHGLTYTKVPDLSAVAPRAYKKLCERGMFGTAVKDWDGFGVPFTLQNFLKAMDYPRFHVWLVETAQKLDGRASVTDDEAGKS